MKAIVIGASGFGRETLDVLFSSGMDASDIAVLDDSPSAANLRRLKELDITYLETVDEWLERSTNSSPVLVAIGAPNIRRTIVSKLESVGTFFRTDTHSTAIVGSMSTFGAGTVVCAGAVISTNVKVGDHVHINPSAVIGHDTVIEDYVSINPNATVSGDVLLGEGCLIGAGAVVLQGLAVGKNAVVGSGAVVTRSVADGAVVMGVPAR